MRWVHDLKTMTDTLRRHARVGWRKFPKLQAVGVEIVSTARATLFRMPDTFEVANPSGYFVSETIRKLNDDKELKKWSYFHSALRGARLGCQAQ